MDLMDRWVDRWTNGWMGVGYCFRNILTPGTYMRPAVI